MIKFDVDPAHKLLVIRYSGVVGAEETEKGLEEIRAVVEGYDEQALLHRWRHPDPAIDELGSEAMRFAGASANRTEAFANLWSLVSAEPFYENRGLITRAAIPYMNEPWYC